MKFFFRISDINTVTERFDYLGPKPVPEKAEMRPAITITEEKPAKTVRFTVPEKKNRQSTTKKVATTPSATTTQVTTRVPSSVDTNKEITEIKNRIQKEPLSEKSSVYTNITLNRSNNVEIITKIQKVSNKNGQPIGLNIIKQTVKKPKPVAVAEKPKTEEVKEKEKKEVVAVKQEKIEEESVGVVETTVKPPSSTEPILPAPVPMEVDLEKSNFLKSIELTAKNSLPAVSPQKVVALETSPKPSPSHKKRKNPSPVKSDKLIKKAKVLKLMKTINNPAVRQIVSNVNNSATNVTKIVERNAPSKDLQTLFDNCKINIPSSLSITLKESSDGDVERRTPVPVKPVQNYIEILRLPDMKDNDGGEVKNKNPRSPQTFQKMFEEAIKKPEFTKLLTVPRKKEQKTALDLSGSDNTKRNATKVLEQGKNGKVAVVKTKADVPVTQQSIDCHSASLGMNYKVSVGQNGAHSPNKVVSSSTVSPPNKPVLPKPTSSLSVTTTTNTSTSQAALSPNHLLEKYNIQNLAQLTASFNLNPAMMSQASQLAALQQAMILKHFEMQNRQNWLNMNPSPLVQYEKYLQSLQTQTHLIGKEN